jgi:uncharacterized repeat protein (TIGR01451 family)
MAFDFHASSRLARGSLPTAGLLLALAVAALAEPGAEMTAVGDAVASGSDLLETTIVVERLSTPEQTPARPRFEAAERLAAGDEVHYTIKVRNPGSRPVTGVQVTKRMPAGVQFVAGSAAGPASRIEYSADGGTTFARRVPEGGPTHLRWTLDRPLPPDSTALLRFRAAFR